MKLNFPKIVRDVSLSEYAPELKEVVQVWVNPPVKLLADIAAAFRVYIDSKGQEGFEGFLVPLSEILSQGTPETHFSVDELKAIVSDTADTDPLFWLWFQGRILDEINTHRQQLKKA